MWKDGDKRASFWTVIQEDFNRLLSHIDQAEAEEDSGIYLLMMHVKNRDDMGVFNVEEREWIKMLLGTLIRQSKRHKKTLGRLSKVLRGYKAKLLKP